MGLHAIGWATGSNGLTQAEANLMFASFALSADPAVQQIAVWAYNGLLLGPAMHAITQTSAFTHDQALTILATIAQGLGTPTAAGALSAEIVSMVTSHQMTADHAIAMLTGFAATSSFHLNNLGVELNALIAANAISFAQAVNDLMHSTLNANQLIIVLTGMSAANSALDPLILNQITTMVHSGALTAAQAMTDIGNAPPEVALRLLTQFGNSTTDIEDAAGNELAILWPRGPACSTISLPTPRRTSIRGMPWAGSPPSRRTAMPRCRTTWMNSSTRISITPAAWAPTYHGIADQLPRQ